MVWRNSDLSEGTYLSALEERLLGIFFGYEAEDKYSDLTSEENHNNYYFFQRFKMMRHEDIDITRNALFYDITGNSLEAVSVFEHSIRCFKKYLIQQIEKSSMGIRDDVIDYLYVFTVPAIGGENAKMIMKEAAVNAGIKKKNLTIVLEPEAASIYCQYLKFAKKDTLSPVLGVVKPGTKYILVHLGSSIIHEMGRCFSTRASITVHQKCEDNTLAEVIPTRVGPWGGKSVDDQFLKFLSELIEEKVWEEFKTKF